MDEKKFKELDEAIVAETEKLSQKFEKLTNEASDVLMENAMNAMLSMFQGLNTLVEDLMTDRVKSTDKPQEASTNE